MIRGEYAYLSRQMAVERVSSVMAGVTLMLLCTSIAVVCAVNAKTCFVAAVRMAFSLRRQTIKLTCLSFFTPAYNLLNIGRCGVTSQSVILYRGVIMWALRVCQFQE